jgi:hypothetical protein
MDDYSSVTTSTSAELICYSAHILVEVTTVTHDCSLVDNRCRDFIH